MSKAADELRDARKANNEAKVSLQTIGEKLAEAIAAIRADDQPRAIKVLGFASKEVDAALEYLNAAHDAHRAIGRCLKTPSAVQEQNLYG